MMAHLGLAVETVLNRSTFATHLIPVDWLAKTTILPSRCCRATGRGERDRRPRSAVHR